MNSQQLQICSFEQAVQLKELGFDWNTESFYREEIDINTNLPCVKFHYEILANWNLEHLTKRYSAPTVALSLKWFRDEKGIKSSIHNTLNSTKKSFFFFMYLTDKMNFSKVSENEFSTYEAAESGLLDELLTILDKEQ